MLSQCCTVAHASPHTSGHQQHTVSVDFNSRLVGYHVHNQLIMIHFTRLEHSSSTTRVYVSLQTPQCNLTPGFLSNQTLKPVFISCTDVWADLFHQLIQAVPTPNSCVRCETRFNRKLALSSCMCTKTHHPIREHALRCLLVFLCNFHRDIVCNRGFQADLNFTNLKSIPLLVYTWTFILTCIWQHVNDEHRIRIFLGDKCISIICQCTASGQHTWIHTNAVFTVSIIFFGRELILGYVSGTTLSSCVLNDTACSYRMRFQELHKLP